MKKKYKLVEIIDEPFHIFQVYQPLTHPEYLSILDSIIEQNTFGCIKKNNYYLIPTYYHFSNQLFPEKSELFSMFLNYLQSLNFKLLMIKCLK